MKIHDIKTQFFLYFIMLPYLKPYNVSLNTELDNFYKIWKVIATILLLLTFIKKKNKLSMQSLIGISFVGIWGLSSYLHTGTIINRAQEMLSIIGIIIIIELIKDSKKLKDGMFSVLYNISAVYIILQFITILKHGPLFGTPENGYDIYFLGGDNHSAFILLPLCSFIFANDFRSYGKIRIRSYILSIMGWFTLIYVFSVAGMIAYGAYILLMICINKPIFQKIITPKKIAIIIVCFIIGVLFFDVQKEFSYIIEMVGKTGLGTREIIWKEAFQVFRNNWIIGVGTLTNAEINGFILNGANHAHNIFLEIIMDTGIIGGLLFGTWMKKIFITKSGKSSKTTKCLVNCFIAYLMCSVFDFYIELIYFYLLILLIYIMKIEDLELVKK